MQEKEVAVASTKAFTSQVTVLALITVWFAQQDSRNKNHDTTQARTLLISSLHKLPTSVGMLINSIHDDCKMVCKKLLDQKTVFVLGKGFGESIAKEGALKIKEITYVHAEGSSSGALKHGPFALIDKGTPIIIIILNDEHKSQNMNSCQQVLSREADVIIITDCDDLPLEQCKIIRIPNCGLLTGLLAVIPLQLIAYELSILKKINPDKPKNLAKTVTVL